MIGILAMATFFSVTLNPLLGCGITNVKVSLSPLHALPDAMNGSKRVS